MEGFSYHESASQSNLDAYMGDIVGGNVVLAHAKAGGKTWVCWVLHGYSLATPSTWAILISAQSLVEMEPRDLFEPDSLTS